MVCLNTVSCMLYSDACDRPGMYCSLHPLGICFLDFTRINFLNLFKYRVYSRYECVSFSDNEENSGIYFHLKVVRGCAVSRGYINVCNSDVFSVVNTCLDHLTFCVLMVNVCLL